jgi:hypothetical protein
MMLHFCQHLTCLRPGPNPLLFFIPLPPRVGSRMSPVVPSVEELAVRGLLDVSIELPGPPSGPVLSLGSFASEATNGPDWISGSALLTPNRSYPVLTTSTERQYPLKVSFQACCSDDPAVNARFRRHAQILTLDTLPKSPGPSYRRKYSRVEEVVAWWEDATGLWLVLIDDGTTLQSESLLRCWSAIMGDDSEEEESTDGLPSDVPRTFSDSSSESAERYGKVCELLLQIVDCLRVSPCEQGQAYARRSMIDRWHWCPVDPELSIYNMMIQNPSPR